MKFFCLLLIIGYVACDSSLSSVLSRLLSEAKSSKNQAPVILVVSNNALQSSSSEETSEENANLWQMLSELQKPRSKPSQKNRSRPGRGQAVFIRSKPEKPSFQLPRSKRPSNVPRAVASLRNSLRCGARNECQDECADKYEGKKAKNCKVVCEVKYECQEEKNECDGGDDDSCGEDSEEKTLSTQALKPANPEDSEKDCNVNPNDC